MECSLVFLGDPPDENSFYEHDHTHIRLDFQEYVPDSTDPDITGEYAINEQRIERVLWFKSSGKLLDIGCGRGYFLKSASENGFNAYGSEHCGTVPM